MTDQQLQSLSPEHLDFLKKMNLYVTEELHFTPREHCLFFIYRFSKSGEYDEAKTKSLILTYIQHYNSLLDRHVFEMNPTDDLFKDVIASITCGLHNFDKQGRPVVIFKFSECDFKGLFERRSVDSVADFFFARAHRIINIALPIMSKMFNRRITELVGIYDFEDTEIFQFLSGDTNQFVKTIAQTGQANYPNTLGKLYLINVPMVFTAVWSVLKLFLHEQTLSKIEITMGGNGEKLLNEIGEDNLHEMYGGKSKGAINDNIGPWKEEYDSSYDRRTIYPEDDSLFDKYYRQCEVPDPKPLPAVEEKKEEPELKKSSWWSF